MTLMKLRTWKTVSRWDQAAARPMQAVMVTGSPTSKKATLMPYSNVLKFSLSFPPRPDFFGTGGSGSLGIDAGPQIISSLRPSFVLDILNEAAVS